MTLNGHHCPSYFCRACHSSGYLPETKQRINFFLFFEVRGEYPVQQFYRRLVSLLFM
jgi:hypothetical protein